MLKAVNLQKTYYTKEGVSQKALTNISIDFDSHGLVFIFGKSGSGKSTLLNILGGLDSMDDGYIEIGNRNSSTFSGDDFDSYRNSYLGFVFQDFNVLEDLTVKENINIAYELQNRKPDEKKLNEILKQIDMLEYTNRRPNELSGGQIQRISIARALIKDPKIILADEPTGNLDSETGEQVLKLLKLLSKDKLVIVVSHDLEFAKKYGDRIIELKDGQVADDLTRHQSDCFKKTTPANIEEKEEINLIKSKLPYRYAFKIGRNSIKHKTARLVLTIFLSVLSIALFGLSDAISRFSVADSSYHTFDVSGYSILPFSKNKIYDKSGLIVNIPPNEEQIAFIEDSTNNRVYTGYRYNILFTDICKNQIPYYNEYYLKMISGVIEMPNESSIQDDFEGDFPSNTKELVINNYMLEHFINYGFKYYDAENDVIETMDNVIDFSDIVGKTVRIRVGSDYDNFMITGMVNYDLEKYHQLKVAWEIIDEFATYEEKKDLDFSVDQYSFLGRFIVKEGFNKANYIDKLSSQNFSVANQGKDQDIYINLKELTPPSDMGIVEKDKYVNKNRIDFSKFGIIDFDDYYFGPDNLLSELGDNDIIVPSAWFGVNDNTELDQYINTKLDFKLITNNYFTGEYEKTDYVTELNIVGFYIGNFTYMNYNVVIPDDLFDYIVSLTVNNSEFMYTYLNHERTDANLFKILDENDFTHNTTLSSGIYNISNVFGIVKTLFLYVAIVILVIVILLIMNFISTSINYKQKDIGILRALGARKTDVFKIFYFEGLIISSISFICSLMLILIGIIVFNDFIRDIMDTNIVLLRLGIRQILFVTLICFATFFLASYLPINKIAKKKPIEAIRKK